MGHILIKGVGGSIVIDTDQCPFVDFSQFSGQKVRSEQAPTCANSAFPSYQYNFNTPPNFQILKNARYAH